MLASLAALVLPGCADDPVVEENPEVASTSEETGNYLVFSLNMLGYDNSNSASSTDIDGGDTSVVIDEDESSDDMDAGESSDDMDTGETRADDDTEYDHNGDMVLYDKGTVGERTINTMTLCVFRADGANRTASSAYLPSSKCIQKIKLNQLTYVSGGLLYGAYKDSYYVAKLEFDMDFTNYTYFLVVLVNNVMGNMTIEPDLEQTYRDWLQHPVMEDRSCVLMPEGYALITGAENGNNLFMSNYVKSYYDASYSDDKNGNLTLGLGGNGSVALTLTKSRVISGSLSKAKAATPLTIVVERSAAKFTVAQGTKPYWANASDLDIFSTVLKVSSDEFWKNAPLLSTDKEKPIYSNSHIKCIAYTYYNMNSHSFASHQVTSNFSGFDCITSEFTKANFDGYSFYNYVVNPKTNYYLSAINWSYTPRYKAFGYRNDDSDPAGGQFDRSYYQSILNNADYKGECLFDQSNTYYTTGILTCSAYFHWLDKAGQLEEKAWYPYGTPCYVTENCARYRAMRKSQTTGMLICAIWKPDGAEFDELDSEGRPQSVIVCGNHCYTDHTYVDKVYQICRQYGWFDYGNQFDDKAADGSIDYTKWNKVFQHMTDQSTEEKTEAQDAYSKHYFGFDDLCDLIASVDLDASSTKADRDSVRNHLNANFDWGIKRYQYGRCYYLVYPRHFSDNDSEGNTVWSGTTNYTVKQTGRYGVVRNHWYELTIGDIQLPGTPYIPKLIPETWTDDKIIDTYYPPKHDVTYTFGLKSSWTKKTVVYREGYLQ